MLQEENKRYLKFTANYLLFSDGNRKSKIMFINKSPNKINDLEGTFLTNKSMKLFNNMLRSINLNKNHIYITNFIPWRLPGDRNFTYEEQKFFFQFIIKQIQLINPIVIIVMNLSIAKIILKKEDNLKYNTWYYLNLNNINIPLINIHNFDDIIKYPIYKKEIWPIFLDIQKIIKN